MLTLIKSAAVLEIKSEVVNISHIPSSECIVWNRGEAGNLSASLSHVVLGGGLPIT